MKTTDLIPLILLELIENDKYGFELTKSIETKSKGRIVIKQPTLYTVLKKLEKSKFISSYWQDSEIGGKRHYYRITDNGRLQASTLPDYNTLVNNINLDEEDFALQPAYSKSSESSENFGESVFESNANNQPAIINATTETESVQLNYASTSKTDEEDDFSSVQQTMSFETAPELKEAVLPSEEVFEQTSIDTQTETETNQNNAELLKKDSVVKDENFANNSNVAQFTNSQSVELSDEYKDKIKSETVFENQQFTFPSPVESDKDEPIRFVEFENIKLNANYIKAKKYSRSMLYKILCSSAYLLLSLIICSVIVNFTKSSALYYTFLILGIIVLIFYPILYIVNLKKFEQKLQTSEIKIDFKKRLIIASVVEILVLVLSLIVSIATGHNSFVKIFGMRNFANLYAPILITSCIYLDILFTFVFIKKSKN